jgi:L-ascorbate metabolism protein UlaG (beta-lactamase superfamily)
MRWLRLLAVLAVALGALAYVFLGTYGPAPVDPAWQAAPSREIPPGSVTVRFTGTSTLVFSDGETTWLTDGWFSRPGPLSLFFGEIEPDIEAIETGLARNELTEAAAVFPMHSHYDHAMDAPEVAQRTGAVLLGSASTANIGRGWGLAESQIRVVADREPIPVGGFTLTPIESQHFQFPDPVIRERALGDPDIREPLVPPVPTFDYKVGKAYVLHVAHPRGSFLVVGSAGFVPGALEGFDVDTVFLGVGGLGTQTEAYREDYWRETIGFVQPRRVIPIHFDSLVGPIEGPFTGEVRAGVILSAGGDETLAFLRAKNEAHPEIEFLTLPRYAPVVVY